ncbi:MAG: copper resistance protein B [Gemmatimonadetes bacterium]|nr:copper resistance protein B [Gemmatimonadota bacterium]
MRIRVRCCLLAPALAVASALGVSTPISAQVADKAIHTFVLFDQLEQRNIRGEQPVAWDMIGWVGGDFNRVWIKSSGSRATRGGGSDAELEALFGRLISPFWDAQIGVRLDTRGDGGARHTRLSAVAALEGLAPYWFEIEPSLFISDRGDISAEFTATYDLFITQRLIAQPRLDLRAAIQEVREFGVGSGLNDAGIGLRLRYELRRKLAPYVGISWNRSFAGTADLARAGGEAVSATALVGGMRLWF